MDVILIPHRSAFSDSCPEHSNNDTNIMFYSRYMSEYDIKRVVYAFHRLLHNYVLFRCRDYIISESILNEVFIHKISEGLEKFFHGAYLYDPWYQPISFKRRYGYIEAHIKIGIADMFANKNRMFKKVFLIIFYKGHVRCVMTKCKKPGSIVKSIYKKAAERSRDVWCRVDFITQCVDEKYRNVKDAEIKALFSTITNEKRPFKVLTVENDLWTVIDFDTETEKWSLTEKNQFVTMMKKKSDPYDDRNLLDVDELEKQLSTKQRRQRKVITTID